MIESPNLVELKEFAKSMMAKVKSKSTSETFSIPSTNLNCFTKFATKSQYIIIHMNYKNDLIDCIVYEGDIVKITG